ncbi:hypothetical protein MASR2M79_05210 [Aminivibrio sp.]
MLRALWTSASGMIAQQTNLDVTTNNLANVNTAGIQEKAGRLCRSSLPDKPRTGSPEEMGSMVPTGVQVGLGTRVVGTTRLMGQATCR